MVVRTPFKDLAQRVDGVAFGELDGAYPGGRRLSLPGNLPTSLPVGMAASNIWPRVAVPSRVCEGVNRGGRVCATWGAVSGLCLCSRFGSGTQGLPYGHGL